MLGFRVEAGAEGLGFEFGVPIRGVGFLGFRARVSGPWVS